MKKSPELILRVFLEKLSIYFATFLHWIFLKSEVIIFMRSAKERTSKNFLAKQYTLKIVDRETIEDAVSMDSLNTLKGLKSLYNVGEFGFYAYLQGLCVHRSWVAIGPRRTPIYFNYLFMDLSGSEALIHFCQTHKDFRGLGIFPAVLLDILEYCFKSKGIDRFYIVAERSNLSSIQGIKKAGFREKERIRFIRFCGINKQWRNI